MFKASRLDHLDLLRGFAALLVLAGHLRAYIFQSFVDLEQEGAHAGVLVKVFYFATGLGHQAVMLFFALSGFLVGGKALNDLLKQRFSWSRYLLRRLTRLWIVVVPILLLTLLLDSIGLGLTLGTGYDGRYYGLYSSGPHGSAGIDRSMLAFLGNLAFLQTIEVPTFGSNGPMWSLANEFWYYIVFPLVAWLALARVSTIGRSIGFGILLTLVVMLPTCLLEGGVIWIAGAAAAWCSHRQALARLLQTTVLRIGAVAWLIAALVASRTPAIGIGDLGLGLVVAFSLPIFAHLPSPGGAYTATARGLSEISFTLYLTHFPLLTLIVLWGIAPVKWPPSMEAAAIYVGLLSLAIAWAAVVWWCFERNTDSVYSMISSKLPLPQLVTVKSR
jgi:peptidoglycan/LPS O-acetylase OafA/YrhL